MDSSDITIRPAEKVDVKALQEIGRTTFTEAFGAVNSPENLQKYLDSKFSPEALAEEVANPDSMFFFAEHDGQVIGYLKINFGDAQTESMPEHTMEIERIYVLAKYYGKGVAKLLFDKAMSLARETNSVTVWLGVWEENPRAIKFYEKNGFVEFDKHSFILGEDVQTDILMKLTLA
ncbi:GNAT family N-acetyltransferase [Fulvivirga kasyanovii]|uniref:GNAT family N-acetyltransferase n=1 Tax=Fulvivirga kasyanovii TaxID=396812 RepID=A0ABW9RQR8_9BACT|nr:GNAT family N-acetyltransferase [Fulvivirga kasyanovii]MTI26371.1 GNAT family N-acetyltransferase [Fulvivirga kasyanovii]